MNRRGRKPRVHQVQHTNQDAEGSSRPREISPSSRELTFSADVSRHCHRAPNAPCEPVEESNVECGDWVQLPRDVVKDVDRQDGSLDSDTKEKEQDFGTVDG